MFKRHIFLAPAVALGLACEVTSDGEVIMPPQAADSAHSRATVPALTLCKPTLLSVDSTTVDTDTDSRARGLQMNNPFDGRSFTISGGKATVSFRATPLTPNALAELRVISEGGSPSPRDAYELAKTARTESLLTGITLPAGTHTVGITARHNLIKGDFLFESACEGPGCSENCVLADAPPAPVALEPQVEKLFAGIDYCKRGVPIEALDNNAPVADAMLVGHRLACSGQLTPAQLHTITATPSDLAITDVFAVRTIWPRGVDVLGCQVTVSSSDIRFDFSKCNPTPGE